MGRDRSGSRERHARVEAPGRELVVAPPVGSPGLRLLAAAAEVGALALADLPGPDDCAGTLSRLTATTGDGWGVRVAARRTAEAAAALADLGPAAVVLVTGPLEETGEALEPLRRLARRLLREVVSRAEAESALALGYDGLVAKGSEGGGRVGAASTFVLLQELAPLAEGRALWVQGGVGPRGWAACALAGATGVVLDNQLALLPEAELRDELVAVLAAMDGSESEAATGPGGWGVRAHRHRASAALGELRRAHDGEAFTAAAARLERCADDDGGLLAVGQEAAFAGPLVRRYGSLGEVLAAYARAAVDAVRRSAAAPPFAAGSPLAAELGIRYPVVQGPMTRVSDVAPFAAAVAEGGGLPFVALALLRRERVRSLLEETAERLGPRPWGVGILGFVPAELRAEQLDEVLAVRPAFALLAGGRPDQAQRLEAAGIRTFLHAPSVGLLRMFLAEGCRRFVLEGRECGGHVGPLASAVLWETAVDAVAEWRAEGSREPVDLLLAGGVHDARSAAMAAVTAAAPATGVRLGVLMGTAYLFTAEAVATGALVPGFQGAALGCDGTVLLDAGGGHAVRCARSPYVERYGALRDELTARGLEPPEVRARLERENVGRLRLASKGLQRAEGGELAAADEGEQARSGLYMMGEVAALHGATTTVAALHREVAEGSTALLERAAGRSTGPRPRPAAEPAPVAIVGMAGLLPGADDPWRLWELVLGRRDAIGEVPRERWRSELFYDPDPTVPDRVISRWGGFLAPVVVDPAGFGIPPASVASIEPLQLLMLEVVRRLLLTSGYHERPFPRERTAVIVGTGGGVCDLGLAYQTRCMVEHYLDRLPGLGAEVQRQVLEGLRGLIPTLTEDSFPGILGNVTAGRVANRFDLGGPSYTVDAACASSLAALAAAVGELRQGSCDLAVLGAADGQQSAFGFLLFSKTHALSPSGRCRPFDAAADGIAISEGVAAVLLKRLDDAVADGDRILAVVRDVGSSSDGRATTLTAPSSEGQRRALERAYARLDFGPDAVDLVEAHGTGTVVGDRAELATVREVLGGAGAAPQSVAVGSVKSQIGHAKNAAGLAGLLKATLALHTRVLPPTLVGEPAPAVRDRALPYYLNTEARPWLQRADGTPRRAGISAFGFGGTNFHVVLEEYAAHRAAARHRPAELLVLLGAGRAELAAQLRTLAAACAAEAPPPLVALAAALARRARRGEGDERLAIVAEEGEGLGERLSALADRLEEGVALPAAGPVASGRGEADGSLAFLFPGQGSQYVGMLRELAVYLPPVHDAVARADAALRDVLPGLLSRAVFPPPPYDDDEAAAQRRHLDQTWLAQPALGAVSWAVVELLARLGVRPDAVAGHSYGEYVALAAAEVLDPATLLRLSERRGRLVQETQGRGEMAMAAVRATPEEVARLAAAVEGLAVAGVNAPRQVIVGGPREAVDAFLTAAQAAGVPGALLSLTAGFHVPEAAPAAERLAAALADVALAPPRLPVYANLDGTPYPADAEGARHRLVDQLVHPVRFRDQVEAMYAAGVRRFLEVGPGQVLSRLVRENLGERPALVLATDHGAPEGGFAAFLAALGSLWAAGTPVRWAALYEGCGVAAADLDALLALPPPPSATAVRVDGGSARPLTTPVVAPGRERRPTAAAAAPAVASAPPPPSGPASAPPGTAAAIAALQATMRDLLAHHERAQEQRHQLMSRFLDVQRSLVAMLGGRVEAPEAGQRPAAVSVPEAAPPPPEPELLEGDAGPSPAPAAAPLAETVLALVSERTGYPVEMLDLDRNLEADLGIDSIKRTEIFGALGERLGLALADGDQEAYFLAIGRLRTLREVIRWLEGVAGTPPEGPEEAEREGGPEPVDEPSAAAAEVGRWVVSVGDGGPVARRGGDAPPSGTVILTADAAGIARELHAGLRAQGVPAVLLGGDLDPAAGVVPVDVTSRGALDAVRGRLRDELPPVGAVLHLLPLAPPGSAGPTLELRSLFAVASSFGADLVAAHGNLLVACRPEGVLGPGRGLAGFRPGAAGLAGFVRCLTHEWPGVGCRVVAVDEATPAERLGLLLLGEIGGGEPVEVLHRDGLRCAPLPEAAALNGGGGLPLPPGGVVLATGGARGITAALCRALAGAAPATFVLAGRSRVAGVEDASTAGCDGDELWRALAEAAGGRGETLTPAALAARVAAVERARSARATIAALEAAGSRVEYHQVDTRDGSAVHELVERTYARHGRLDGVLHGAGVVDDQLLLAKAGSAFDEVVETKVEGALALARAVRPESLGFFVLLSSIAAHFGYPGGTDYAAANDILGRLAWRLDREWPGRVVALAWGPWAEVGIASRYRPEVHARQGLLKIPVAVASELFLAELAHGRKGEAEVLLYAGRPGSRARSVLERRSSAHVPG